MSGRMPQRIDVVLSTVLQHAQTQRGAVAVVRRQWKQLVGRELAMHTQPVSLRRGRLVVHAERPGDGFTLTYQLPALLKRVQAMTQQGVHEIIVRPGALHRR